MKRLLCHLHIFWEACSVLGVIAKILKSASHTCAHTHLLHVEILVGIALNLKSKLQ